MYKKLIELLKVMSGSGNKYITSQELSERLDISTRTVMRYMRALKDQEDEGGFIINKMKGKGYSLEIRNLNAYKKFQQQNEDSIVQDIIFILLLSPFRRLEDIADYFHYSRSGMIRFMRRAEQELNRNGIQLINKPYIGYYITGNEIYIRNFFYKKIEQKSIEKLLKLFNIKEELVEKLISQIYEELTCRNNDHVDEKLLQFFLKYLLIQMSRIKIKRYVESDNLVSSVYTKYLDRDIDAVSRIQDVYQKYVGDNKIVLISKVERIYLSLVYRQAFWQNGIVDEINENTLAYYQNIIETSLDKIQKSYGVDLKTDENLTNGLILHVASSFKRYLLGIHMENEFYQEVFETYPTAYYYSIAVAEEISKQTRLTLGNEEIGFLGMHFASYIERTLRTKKWRSAIICGTGLGTAYLLESKIKNKYPDLVILGTYSVDDIKNIEQDVDFYISTIPLNQSMINHKSCIQLSPLLDINEQMRLEELLVKKQRNSFGTVVPARKIYIEVEEYQDKMQLLVNMCTKLIKDGIISNEIKDQLIEREKLVATELTEGIAMPHVLTEKESFFVILLLKHPVYWGHTMVSLAIMAFFCKHDKEIKKELEIMFHAFMNEEQRKKLLLCENKESVKAFFDTLMDNESGGAL